MFGIIVGTHGQFAPGIVQSCEMIFGTRDKLKAVTLMLGEGPDMSLSSTKRQSKNSGIPTEFCSSTICSAAVPTMRLAV